MVAVVIGVVFAGCAAPSPTPEPVPAPEPAQGLDECRAVPAPEAPWDVAGYYPISLEGMEIDIVYLMLAHPVSMNWKAGMEREAAKYGFNLNHFDYISPTSPNKKRLTLFFLR